MSGTATWQQWKVPVRFTSMTRSHACGGDVGERREVDHAGTGHQDVHRSELGAHLRERLLDGRAVADVGRHRQRRHTFGAQLLGNPLRGCAVEVKHGDLVAAPAQLVTGRLTHAGSAAGHHRDPAHR